MCYKCHVEKIYKFTLTVFRGKICSYRGNRERRFINLSYITVYNVNYVQLGIYSLFHIDIS